MPGKKRRSDPAREARNKEARDRLKTLRESGGWSQKEFASWLGISYQAYGKKERGEDDGFSIGDFVKIIEETKIDAQWLFGQKNGDVKEARFSPSNNDDVMEMRRVIAEYRSWKESLSNRDLLSQRIQSDKELHECVEMLIENRSMVGRVIGYIEGRSDESREREGA